MQTITVVPVEGFNALKMTWGEQIEENDIALAFRSVTNTLKLADKATDVIIDITSNPQFPMQTVISETLGGPFKHPLMGSWLVVGSSRAARIIANVLNRVSGRSDIMWFPSEKEALAYLASGSLNRNRYVS